MSNDKSFVNYIIAVSNTPINNSHKYTIDKLTAITETEFTSERKYCDTYTEMIDALNELKASIRKGIKYAILINGSYYDGNISYDDQLMVCVRTIR